MISSLVLLLSFPTGLIYLYLLALNDLWSFELVGWRRMKEVRERASKEELSVW